MKNRINLDDPDYNQDQRIVVRDSQAKKLWVVLGIIAVIVIICTIAVSMNYNSKESRAEGTVITGKVSDFYDDDGDGWVDRAYNRQVQQWAYFNPGEYPLSSVQ